MLTLYEILGVPAKAGADEVKFAYRKLAREYHPDLNPDPKSHERMAQINVAFEVLSDPVRRMEYDASIGQHVNDEPHESKTRIKPRAVAVTIRQRLRDHRTPLYALSYVPGSSRLVSSSFDNEILWWDNDCRFPQARTKLEGGVVSAISVQGDRKLVAAGTTEQNVTCWTVDGEKVKSWRISPPYWVTTVVPSPDGQSVALGGVDRSLKVVRSSDGFSRFSCPSHQESVTAVAWSSDSSLLASGSADATAKIWCGATGRLLHTILPIRSTVTALAFSPDHQWLAVAAVDLSVRVFNLKDYSLQKTFHGHSNPIETLAFHPKSWLLGSGGRDGTVGLWNVRHGLGHGLLEASHQPISSIAFSPDGLSLAAGGLDKVVRVWNLSAVRTSPQESAG